MIYCNMRITLTKKIFIAFFMLLNNASMEIKILKEEISKTLQMHKDYAFFHQEMIILYQNINTKLEQFFYKHSSAYQLPKEAFNNLYLNLKKILQKDYEFSTDYSDKIYDLLYLDTNFVIESITKKIESCIYDINKMVKNTKFLARYDEIFFEYHENIFFFYKSNLHQKFSNTMQELMAFHKYFEEVNENFIEYYQNLQSILSTIPVKKSDDLYGYIRDTFFNDKKKNSYHNNTYSFDEKNAKFPQLFLKIENDEHQIIECKYDKYYEIDMQYTKISSSVKNLTNEYPEIMAEINILYQHYLYLN